VIDPRRNVSGTAKKNKALALLKPTMVKISASKPRHPIACSVKKRRLVQAPQIAASVQRTAVSDENPLGEGIG
jgi:hypothetical protein